jgi:hypothetical protein
MCDVHLIETSRFSRDTPEDTRCCYCGERIRGQGVYVEGHLDDGSPGLYRFIYHEDCAWDMEHDLDEIEAHEGCFSYGEPVDVSSPLQGDPVVDVVETGRSTGEASIQQSGPRESWAAVQVRP